MPNIGASKHTKRRLLALVVTSQLLYGAEVWADLMRPGGWIIITSCQRKILLRVASAHKTVSTDALQVITNSPPIKLVAEERKTLYEARIKKINPLAMGELESQRAHIDDDGNDIRMREAAQRNINK